MLLLSSGDLYNNHPSSFSVAAEAGRFEQRAISALARTAASDDFAATLSAAFEQRDGMVHNTRLGARVDDQESYSVAARARWSAWNAAEITAQLLANRQRNGAQPLVPLNGPLFKVQRDREGQTDIDLIGGAIKVEVPTRLGALSSVTSHTWWSLDPYTNEIDLPPALDGFIRQTQRAWNEELRLSGSRDDSWWLLGAWLSTAATDGAVERSIAGLFPIEASEFVLRLRTAALFGEWGRDLTRWSVTAGLRAETCASSSVTSQFRPWQPWRIGSVSMP